MLHHSYDVQFLTEPSFARLFFISMYGQTVGHFVIIVKGPFVAEMVLLVLQLALLH